MKNAILPIIKNQLAIVAASTLLLVSCGQSENADNTLALKREDKNVSENKNPEKPCKCMDNKPRSPFADTINQINHSITLDIAVTMVKNFEAKKTNLKPQSDPGMIPSTETFNLKAIDDLICQPKVVAFRIYSGLDENFKIRFIMVGVEADGKDVIGRKIADPTFQPSQSGLIFDNGQRLP